MLIFTKNKQSDLKAVVQLVLEWNSLMAAGMNDDVRFSSVRL